MKLENKIQSIFPNLEPLAYYDTFSQYIKLNFITINDYKELLSDVLKRKKNENAGVYYHELQHWYDHQSTLWGIRNQVEILNAYNIRLQAKYIEEYHKIPKLIKEIEKQNFLNYYHEKINHIVPNSIEDRWRMQYSAGYRFDHNGQIDRTKPISFVRFLSNSGEPVCRTPLSLASLLETIAKATEIEVKLEYIMALDSDDARLEMRNLNAQYFDWLYNPDMTLYSVAAHLTSNILDEKLIIFAFELSKKVATLTLNLPLALYSRIKIPEEFLEFGEKNKYFIENCDIGYAYHCLLRNYSNTFKKEKEFNIESILKCSELPNLNEFEESVITEISDLKNGISNGPFNGLIDLKIRQAIKLFKQRGAFNQGGIDFSMLMENNILPIIIFSDSDLNTEDIELSSVADALHNSEVITELEYIHLTRYAVEKIYEFYSICGI